MLSLFGHIVLQLLGIKIIGSHYPDIPKKIYAVAPHTSNWDFPLGILVKWKLKVKLNFLGKKSLFKPLYCWFFRMFGGIPVDRSKSSNTVQAVANSFSENDKMTLAIAPEGTRKKVDAFKKGFYHIAKTAEVPIVLVTFDFKNKKILFGEPFFPSDDEDKDWAYINSYFDGVMGKVAENSIGYGKG